MRTLSTNLKLFLSGAACLIFLGSATAQNIQGIDVNSLSASQIKQAGAMLENSGLSVEQAIEEARKNGASDAQIQQMIRRLKGDAALRQDTQLTVSPLYGESLIASDSLAYQEHLKMAAERDSLKEEKMDTLSFGSYLFQNDRLIFEPNLNIQTPRNYMVNMGDEILINVWGSSVADYQLTVDENGQIYIPKLGPLFVAGKSFDSVTSLIRKRLTAIYSDMGGSEPGTFAQIHMGRLRSVQVNVIGDVTAPGSFTVPATATVFNVLYLSGGPSEYGSFRKIEIHRDGALHRSLDLYDFLLRADQSDNVILENQDVVFIPVSRQRILTTGEIKRIAYFEVLEHETLADLLYFAGGFKENAYRKLVKVYRQTQKGPVILDVPDTRWGEFTLEDGDRVHAEKIVDQMENQVILSGSVYRPGYYQWEEGLTLRELILRADSVVSSAEVELGHLTRVNADSTLSLVSFHVARVLSGEEDMLLQPKDSIMIKSHYELKDRPMITVDGRVREGGSFPYLDRMSVLDAVYMAGGFREDADTNYVQVSRRLSYDLAAKVTDKLVDVFNIPLSRDLKKGAAGSDFMLQPYDHIFVRKAPGAQDQGRVYIGGEVMYSGFYAIQNKKDRISDLVEWSGGLTPESYLDAATFSRVDAGMVGIQLSGIINNPGIREDLRLQPGDSLYIPQRPETVNVSGEVQNPFATVYVPNKSVKYYIERSGGWGERPHRRRIYVTYPDGSSAMTKSFIWWSYPRVKPGTEIYVPQKPERQSSGEGFSRFLATASALASLGITISTLANILDRN